MKLSNIILEKRSPGSFKTTETGFDPETGTHTWDVEYDPIYTLDSDLQKAYDNFKTVVDKHEDDVVLKRLFIHLGNFKKQLRTYITKQYGR